MLCEKMPKQNNRSDWGGGRLHPHHKPFIILTQVHHYLFYLGRCTQVIRVLDIKVSVQLALFKDSAIVSKVYPRWPKL